MLQDLTTDVAEQFGTHEARAVLVSQVAKGPSGASTALRLGDVIVRYGGAEVQDARQLRKLIAGTTPGTQARLEIVRDRKHQTVIATVGKQAGEATRGPRAFAEEANSLERLGLSVRNLTPALARYLGLDGHRGVLVFDVERQSAASIAGVRRGDLILEASRTPIASAEELAQAVGASKSRDHLLLLVKRKDASIFVVLPTR